MARRLTTSNLVADVRSLIDEQNQTSIEDLRDILPALNRAQDIAANTLARCYESPLLAYTFQTLTSAQQEYPIPRTAFENRLEKVEVQIQTGIFQPVKRQSYRDTTLLESTAVTAIPMFYSEIGDVYRLYPRPTGAYPLRIWYLQDPLPLVLEQGTITVINAAQNYVVVDTPGSALTTQNDQTSSYVNFVDGTTGVIKGSAQIQSISNGKITFKTVPTRTSVLEQPISGTLPAQNGAIPALALGDLICTVDGNCISVLKKPFANFLIQMAVSELLNTKLGIQSELAEKVRAEMQVLVKESWVGRESYMRIRSASPTWESVGRRYGNRF